MSQAAPRRFADTTQAHEGYAGGGLRTSPVDLIEDISAIDKVRIAAEGDSREVAPRQRYHD